MVRVIRKTLAGRFALLTLGILTACSPRFNWREVRTEDGFVALFPARIERDNRTVMLGKQSANLILTGAEVDHITFAIGVANLADRADLDQARSDYEMSLLANFKGVTPERSAAEVPLVSSKARIPADQIVARDANLAVVARFAIRANRVVEMLVAAPVGVADSASVKEARDTFFQSAELF
jgi:hypothetical protein